MDRLTLAKDLFIAYMKSGKPIQIETSFLLADDFLLQDSKQRKPKACEPEPEIDRSDIGGDYMVKCNHAHTNSTFTTGLPAKEISRVCTLCGVSVLPEPPKPERVAMEWWLRIGDFEVMPTHTNGMAINPYGDDWVKVREVLPGDEK